MTVIIEADITPQADQTSVRSAFVEHRIQRGRIKHAIKPLVQRRDDPLLHRPGYRSKAAAAS